MTSMRLELLDIRISSDARDLVLGWRIFSEPEGEHVAYGLLEVFGYLHIVDFEVEGDIREVLAGSAVEPKHGCGFDADFFGFLDGCYDVWRIAAAGEGQEEISFAALRIELVGEYVFVVRVVCEAGYDGGVVG